MVKIVALRAVKTNEPPMARLAHDLFMVFYQAPIQTHQNFCFERNADFLLPQQKRWKKIFDELGRPILIESGLYYKLVTIVILPIGPDYDCNDIYNCHRSLELYHAKSIRTSDVTRCGQLWHWNRNFIILFCPYCILGCVQLEYFLLFYFFTFSKFTVRTAGSLKNFLRVCSFQESDSNPGQLGRKCECHRSAIHRK